MSKKNPTTRKAPLGAGKKKDDVVFLKSQLARALADYDNLAKRVERERGEIEERIKSQVVARLLPAIDMVYDAQKHLKDQGLAMAIGEIENSLKDEGIERIAPKNGDKFDESLHEAVDAIDIGENPTSPEASLGARAGSIESVDKPGWKFTDGGVIRHAKVKVFK